MKFWKKFIGSQLSGKHTTSITYNMLHRKLQSSSRELKLKRREKGWGEGEEATTREAQAVRLLPVLQYQTSVKHTSPKIHRPLEDLEPARSL